MIKRKLIPYVSILLTFISTEMAQGVDDPWPLFDRADHVLYGTVVEVLEGERDRLYQINTDQEEGLDSPSSTWWLREPEGAGTEGIGANIGNRGAWLVANVVGGEFPAANATILPGGFLSIDNRHDTTKLMKLKTGSTPETTALNLIHSQNQVIKRIAIGWLRTSSIEPEADQMELIQWAFGREYDTAVQRSWLELFLQKQWTFSDPGLADLIPFSTDPAVSMLAQQYLKQNGTIRQRARLVSAWPTADLEAKKRLAIAYRKLSVVEASPWLLQGITAANTTLRALCIESIGGIGGIHLENTYTSLLRSTDQQTRASALRGLARNQTIGSWQLLNQAISEMDTNDPLKAMAIALKRHPWKTLSKRR